MLGGSRGGGSRPRERDGRIRRGRARPRAGVVSRHARRRRAPGRRRSDPDARAAARDARPISARRSPSPTASRRMRYANQAAADLLGVRDAGGAPGTAAGDDRRPMGVHARGRPPDGGRGRPELQDRQRAARRAAADADRATARPASSAGAWSRPRPCAAPAGELMAVSVIEDVTEAKEAELRQRFLAQAGVTLTSSLDYEETLQRVAQLVVPGLADWCAVDVADANQRLNQVAVAHVDPDKVAFAREFRSRYPPDPNDDSGHLRRAALRASRALSRAPRRAARAEHRGSRAAARPSARWACARSCSSRWSSPGAPSGC